MSALFDLDEIEERAKAATNVLWFPGHLCRADHDCNCRYVFACNDTMGSVAEVSEPKNDLSLEEGGNDNPPLAEAKANQAHIAGLSPPVALALVARIRELEAIVASQAVSDA